MKLNEYLKQPYPKIVHKWKLTVAISFFISFFLGMFKPFGLSEYQSDYNLLVYSGYGVVTFIILIINLFIITRILKFWFANWTILKQTIWISWIIFTIGTGNYFYSSVLFPFFSGFKGFLIFQFFTLVVAIFPVVTITLVSQIIKLSNNLKTASEINYLLNIKQSVDNSGKTIVLIADNEKDRIEVELSCLLYIESAGNYIQINYIKDNKLTKALLRSTIKRIESQLIKYPSVVKCHRAFLINITQIKTVKGHSQGLKIILKNTDFEVPVSRNYSRKIKNSLTLISQN